MKTQELLSLFEEHKNQFLYFEYQPNAFVGSNYHITEVKHVKIDSVDCGSQSDSWNETIIQLWESPIESTSKNPMNAYKALKILTKVAEQKPYDLNSEVKFEYGNSKFHTAHLFVNDFVIQDNKLILKLAHTKTDCKAKELCGIPDPIVAVAEATACCSPETGCC